MNRRKQPARRAPAKPAPRPRRPRASALVASVTLALFLGYVAWQRITKPAISPPTPPLASSPADRMAAVDAYTEGLRLGKAGHHLAALPYFRSAASQAPNSWTARENYANTLVNGAQEVRHHLGKDEPATRSSVERMEMIEESVRQTDFAASLAQDPRDQAVVFAQRAQTLYTFGLAVNTLVELRRAAGIDPSSAPIARAIATAEKRLRSGGLAE